MRYLLLIYGDESTAPANDEAMAAMWTEYGAFSQDIAERGMLVVGEALQPPAAATTVRVRDGRTLTTDGPFAETKEVLGGFYMIQAADLDEAIETAARIPGARFGSIEVRPIMEMGG